MLPTTAAGVLFKPETTFRLKIENAGKEIPAVHSHVQRSGLDA
ncbi:MAG TPA: hypothetical protein VJ692_04495 [Nitrospiraceae bacterium]|nr:hypothetical protein [Nitrospiraceae bacterium]